MSARSKVEEVSWLLKVGVEFLLWLFNELKLLYRFRGRPDDERLADIAWTAPWRSSASGDGVDRVGRQQYLYFYFMGHLVTRCLNGF